MYKVQTVNNTFTLESFVIEERGNLLFFTQNEDVVLVIKLDDLVHIIKEVTDD